MFPQILWFSLQDAKKAPVRVLLGALIVIATILGLLQLQSRLFPSMQRKTPEQPVSASEPTPVPKTGTFVDDISGTVLFLRSQALYELTLPDRTIRQIVGLRPSEVTYFLPMRPVWSLDGHYLVVMADTSHLYVSEYDTGKFVGSFTLREPLRAGQQVVPSIDPSDEILAIGVADPEGIREESVLFATLATQKELGFYPHCSARGIWLPRVGYVLRCSLAETANVNVIQFEPASSSMFPLTQESKSLSYSLIDAYGGNSVLALRKRGTVSDLVTLSLAGKIVSLPSSFLPKNVSPVQFAFAEDALKRRIEKELHISGVANVSVASSNDWLVYETSEGLFANTIKLDQPSFALGPGSLPSIRPY